MSLHAAYLIYCILPAHTRQRQTTKLANRFILAEITASRCGSIDNEISYNKATIVGNGGALSYLVLAPISLFLSHNY